MVSSLIRALIYHFPMVFLGSVPSGLNPSLLPIREALSVRSLLGCFVNTSNWHLGSIGKRKKLHQNVSQVDQICSVSNIPIRHSITTSSRWRFNSLCCDRMSTIGYAIAKWWPCLYSQSVSWRSARSSLHFSNGALISPLCIISPQSIIASSTSITKSNTTRTSAIVKVNQSFKSFANPQINYFSIFYCSNGDRNSYAW